MKRRPPLLGFNHNVRHAGRLYHVQTEDSGAAKPHIITHVFYSGTILATTRTSYASDETERVVQTLMQGQHKAVLKQLRNGTFDEKLREYFHSRGESFGEAPEAMPGIRMGAESLPPPATGSRPPAGPARPEPSLIRKFNLERLDAPGATIATTEPYNPIMSEFDRMSTHPRGLLAGMDADLSGLLELAASAEEVAERLGPGSGQADPGPSAGDEEWGEVLELEAEPPSEDEVQFSRPVPRPPILETVLPVRPPEIEVNQQEAARPRPYPFPRPVSGRTPTQRTTSGVLRSSARSPRRGVVVVPQRTVSPPVEPQEKPEQAPGDLPAEHTRVRQFSMGDKGSRQRETLTPRPVARSDAPPFRPRPTAEGVVMQRPVYVFDQAKKGPETKGNPQPITAPRIEKDQKAPLPTDERSLDQVILAYLAEDLNNKR